MSKEQKYYLTQKLVGIGMILLGILTAIIADGDITASIIMVPMGLVLLFSKDKILTTDYFFEELEKKDGES